MANHASAEKRDRQRQHRTARNRAVKSRFRTVLKRARAALDEGTPEAPELVGQACRLLDRAASKRVVPQARASRLKSRLSKKLGARPAGEA
ncbi:MAG: 30S ribosomal protein S20 [Deltaproteobacteria bacterium]|nr:30S ribosomal protein S20 [Deltaproteobacteria bacterium]